MNYSIEDNQGSTVACGAHQGHISSTEVVKKVRRLLTHELIEDGNYTVHLYNEWNDEISVLDINIDKGDIHWI